MVHRVVAQSRDFRIGGIVTPGAGHISIPADLQTGDCLGLMGDLVVAGGDFFLFHTAGGAGKHGKAVCLTGHGFQNHFLLPSVGAVAVDHAVHIPHQSLFLIGIGAGKPAIFHASGDHDCLRIFAQVAAGGAACKLPGNIGRPDIGRLQIVTITERRGLDGCHILRDRHGNQVRAEEAPGLDLGQAIRQIDLPDRAVDKGIGTDGLDGIRQHYRLHIPLAEGIIADVTDRQALHRRLHDHLILAAKVAGKIHLPVISLHIEAVLHQDHLLGCQIAGRAAVAGAAETAGIPVAFKQNRQIAAIHKRRAACLIDLGRNSISDKLGLAVKGIGTDAGDRNALYRGFRHKAFFVPAILGQPGLAVPVDNIGGILCLDHLFGLNVVAAVIVPDRACLRRLTIPQQDHRQIFGAVKGEVANGCDTGRQGDRPGTGKAVKGIIADLGNAACDLHLAENVQIVEQPVSQGRHALTDTNIVDLAVQFIGEGGGVMIRHGALAGNFQQVGAIHIGVGAGHNGAVPVDGQVPLAGGCLRLTAVHTGLVHEAVALGSQVLRVGVAANRTGVGQGTGGGTGGRCAHSLVAVTVHITFRQAAGGAHPGRSAVLAPAMAQRRDLHVGAGVAAAAGVVCLPAHIVTGSCPCRVVDVVVAQFRDLCIGIIVTAVAGLIGVPADLGTGGGLACVVHIVVAQGRIDLALQPVVTAGTAGAVAPAALGTGRGLGFDGLQIVAQPGDRIGPVAVAAAVADHGGIAVCRTGGGGDLMGMDTARIGHIFQGDGPLVQVHHALAAEGQRIMAVRGLQRQPGDLHQGGLPFAGFGVHIGKADLPFRKIIIDDHHAGEAGLGHCHALQHSRVIGDGKVRRCQAGAALHGKQGDSLLTNKQRFCLQEGIGVVDDHRLLFQRHSACGAAGAVGRQVLPVDIARIASYGSIAVLVRDDLQVHIDQIEGVDRLGAYIADADLTQGGRIDRPHGIFRLQGSFQRVGHILEDLRVILHRKFRAGEGPTAGVGNSHRQHIILLEGGRACIGINIEDLYLLRGLDRHRAVFAAHGQGRQHGIIGIAHSQPDGVLPCRTVRSGLKADPQ